MLQVGQLNEIAEEILKYGAEITALQEIRWERFCKIEKEHTLYHRGKENNRGQQGTGFSVN